MKTIEFIHYGSSEFDREKFENARNDSRGLELNKPMGGLWASPINSKWGWIDWCESEDYGSKRTDPYFKFKLKEGSNVMVIDCTGDLQACFEKYGVPGRFSNRYYIDWDKLIADGYDAVYLTERGNQECRRDLDCWDCESIVVLNQECIKEEEV